MATKRRRPATKRRTVAKRKSTNRRAKRSSSWNFEKWCMKWWNNFCMTFFWKASKKRSNSKRKAPAKRRATAKRKTTTRRKSASGSKRVALRGKRRKSTASKRSSRKMAA